MTVETDLVCCCGTSSMLLAELETALGLFIVGYSFSLDFEPVLRYDSLGKARHFVHLDFCILSVVLSDPPPAGRAR